MIQISGWPSNISPDPIVAIVEDVEEESDAIVVDGEPSPLELPSLLTDDEPSEPSP